MKNPIKLLALGLMTLSSITVAKAQFVEDALRYSNYNSAISARAAGLNVSYHGVADDGAAMFYNPAGLTLIGQSELMGSLGFSSNKPDVNFLDSKSNLSTSTGLFNNLCLTSLVSIGENRAAVGLGYFLENDFNSTAEINAFNSTSSYIGEQSLQHEAWVKELYLAESNFNPKVTKNVNQYAFIREKGGLHNLTGAASFDINKNFAIGFSVTGKWGTFDYSRNFVESDPTNLHNTYNYDDFNKVTLDETLSQSVSAITAAIGAQFRIEDFMRVGFTIKLPTSYSVTEDFGKDVSVLYDKDSVGVADFYKATPTRGSSSYSIYVPFVYCAGASMHIEGLTITSGIEYSDMSQLEFNDDNLNYSDLNKTILKELTGRLSWGLGAEYKLPVAPIIARASISETSSPYSKEIIDSKITNISLGASFIAGDNLKIDAAFKFTNYDELKTVYGYSDDPANYAYYTVKNTPVNFTLGVTYRY